MFYKLNKSTINGEDIIYLYLDNNYEFSKELQNFNIEKAISSKVKEYLTKNNIDYKNKKVFIVSNNLIIGTINFSNLLNEKIEQYVDFNNVFKENENIEIIDVVKPNDYKNRQNIDINYYQYIKNVLSSNIPINFEKEAIKTIVILLKTNCLSDIDKYGQIIKEKDDTDIINDQLFEKKINDALEETKNDCLLTNNHLQRLEDKLDNKNFQELKRINVMAKAGYNYKQILNHFYPESKINPL